MHSPAEIQPGQAVVVVLMGVTGVGKSTIGGLLARDLGWAFEDADAFHPPRNVEKMRSGVPLTDADRLPWLRAMRRMIVSRLEAGESCVVACSALRESYRKELHHGDERVLFVHLVAPAEVIRRRMHARTGHFMPPTLLDSQIDTLEVPPYAVTVEADGPPRAIVRAIRKRLRLVGRTSVSGGADEDHTDGPGSGRG